MKGDKKAPVKGQRSIASFLFKPQAAQAASVAADVLSSQAAGKRPASTEAAAPDHTKRRRTAVIHSHHKEDGLGSSSLALVNQHQLPDVVHPQRTASPATTVHPSEGVSSIPRRVDNLYKRFQLKMVDNTGKRATFDNPSNAATTTKQAFTPLEKQVAELKQNHPGVLLIIEVGYKMRFFGDDAEVAAKICNIFCYPDRNFMTASVPVPRLHVYVRRLVEAGYKAGVVRQTESAAIKAAGSNRYAPFERKLTALYTRSTLEAGLRDDVGESSMAGRGSDAWGNQRLSSFLVCVVEGEAAHGAKGDVELGLVAVEISTGDVLFSQFRDSMMRTNLEARLMYAAPSELLVAKPISLETEKLLDSYSVQTQGLRSESVDRATYGSGGALAAVSSFYGSDDAGGDASLDAIHSLPPLVVIALAHALEYLKPFGLESVLRFGACFRPYNAVHEMTLSPNALSQLEVLKNNDDGGEKGTLLWLLDHTRTAFGGRLLRTWVSHPLTDRDDINRRLDAVQELAAVISAGEEGHPVGKIPELLAVPDLERGITRIFHRTASPAEYLVMVQALAAINPQLRLRPVGLEGNVVDVRGVESGLLQQLLQDAGNPEVASTATDLLELIDKKAAAQNDKINLFTSRQRFPEVFASQESVDAAERTLQELLPAIRKQLRLPRLEYITLMNQGDYLIEVPVEHGSIPKDWEKVSSTKKMHRFHPPQVKAALKELELSKEHRQAACEAAWQDFLSDFGQHYVAFRRVVQALAALDALAALASTSSNDGYVRPEFVDEESEPQISIEEGRHPVLDVLLSGRVVPNDIALSATGCQACIITGPNMGGKSCYIKQVALSCIMAQVGCFVPARAARLHVVDAILTRMGARDNLALGRSTFLEELTEASHILAAATPRSLVIIDELGRGTSTHDGLAIALATLHHILSAIHSLTLFVTHYPQVAQLQTLFPKALGTFSMSYVEGGLEGVPADAGGKHIGPRSITFLYKLVAGVADRSFGLNVARMAHLPASVVDRAVVKSAEMEAASIRSRRRAKLDKRVESAEGEHRALVSRELLAHVQAQLNIVVAGDQEQVLQRLRSLQHDLMQSKIISRRTKPPDVV